MVQRSWDEYWQSWGSHLRDLLPKQELPSRKIPTQQREERFRQLNAARLLMSHADPSGFPNVMSSLLPTSNSEYITKWNKPIDEEGYDAKKVSEEHRNSIHNYITTETTYDASVLWFKRSDYEGARYLYLYAKKSKLCSDMRLFENALIFIDDDLCTVLWTIFRSKYKYNENTKTADIFTDVVEEFDLRRVIVNRFVHLEIRSILFEKLKEFYEEQTAYNLASELALYLYLDFLQNHNISGVPAPVDTYQQCAINIIYDDLILSEKGRLSSVKELYQDHDWLRGDIIKGLTTGERLTWHLKLESAAGMMQLLRRDPEGFFRTYCRVEYDKKAFNSVYNNPGFYIPWSLAGCIEKLDSCVRTIFSHEDILDIFRYNDYYALICIGDSEYDPKKNRLEGGLFEDLLIYLNEDFRKIIHSINSASSFCNPFLENVNYQKILDGRALFAELTLAIEECDADLNLSAEEIAFKILRNKAVSYPDYSLSEDLLKEILGEELAEKLFPVVLKVFENHNRESKFSKMSDEEIRDYVTQQINSYRESNSRGSQTQTWQETVATKNNESHREEERRKDMVTSL